VTTLKEDKATEILKKNSWNVNQALDHYYANTKLYSSSSSSSSSSSGKGDKSKLGKIFDKYAGTEGKEKDVMFGDKLAGFFKDVGVDAEKEGAVTLGVAWKLKAKTLGEFSRTEFVEGFAAMGDDTADKIKSEISSIKSALANKTTFRDFFRWLFDYVKEDSDRKSIDIEPAIEMMSIVLPQHFDNTSLWIEFLKGRKEKTISKDIWEQTFEFVRDIKSDFSNYEDEDAGGAWPVVFDEFVVYAKEKKGIKSTKGSASSSTSSSSSSSSKK